MGDAPAPAPADKPADLSAVIAHAAYLAVPMIGMLGLVFAGASSELVLTWLMASGLSTGSQAVFSNVRKVRQSIGETNGADIATLLHTIVDFESYQHDSNHKIVNAVTPLAGNVQLILNKLDELAKAS